MRHRIYSVYILFNRRHTVFYVGVTNDLVRRVFEHKVKHYKKGFTANTIATTSPTSRNSTTSALQSILKNN